MISLLWEHSLQQMQWECQLQGISFPKDQRCCARNLSLHVPCMPLCGRAKGKPVPERFRTPLTADSALRILEGLIDHALDRIAVHSASTRSFSSLSFPRGQTCIMDWGLSWPFLAPSLFSLLVISPNKVHVYWTPSWHLLLSLMQLTQGLGEPEILCF